MERIDITAEKTITGYLRLSTVAGDRYFERKYNGYSKREAMQMFRSEIRAELARDFIEQR